MAEQDDEDAARLREWEARDTDLVPTTALTVREAVPVELLEPEPDTAPLPVSELPGFEPGYVLGRRRALADAVEVLRLDLISWGNDPGKAALISQAFGRACGLRYL